MALVDDCLLSVRVSPTRVVGVLKLRSSPICCSLLYTVVDNNIRLSNEDDYYGLMKPTHTNIIKLLCFNF